MPVLRSILHGFGFTVGARAATEILDEIGKDDPPASAPPPSSFGVERQRAARAKEAKRREREIDKELRALKKRISPEP